MPRNRFACSAEAYGTGKGVKKQMLSALPPTIPRPAAHPA